MLLEKAQGLALEYGAYIARGKSYISIGAKGRLVSFSEGAFSKLSQEAFKGLLEKLARKPKAPKSTQGTGLFTSP